MPSNCDGESLDPIIFHMKVVVCIYDAFEDNFRIKQILRKYLEENCRLSFKEQFSLNYFPYVSFVRKILPK